MCVILYTQINGMNILAKNRDRTYKTEIEIIHEIVNGMEIAYIHDKQSGWIEGMNEKGVGIVNSTLSKSDDRILSKEKILGANKKKKVIYKILIDKNYDNNLFDIIKHNDNHYVLEGHTIISYNNEIYHVENNKNNHFVIEKIIKPSVFTNHGIILKKEGFTKGRKGVSSFLRKKIMENELKENITSIDELEHNMNKNYINIDPRFHPYRDKNFTIKRNHLNKDQIFISTTGQLIMNLTNKEFTYYRDTNNSKNIKYINKLPSNYAPRIRITIKEIEKNLKPVKFLNKNGFLKKTYKKFHYHGSNNRKTMKRKNK